MHGVKPLPNPTVDVRRQGIVGLLNALREEGGREEEAPQEQQQKANKHDGPCIPCRHKGIHGRGGSVSDRHRL